MMTDEQKSKVAELKTAIAAASSTRDGTPREIRERVVTLKKALQCTGTTARALAAALGLHETTLCRWEREGGARADTPMRAGGFRRVRVATPAPQREIATVVERAVAPRQGSTSIATSRGLRVAHAPSGLVVDGLDVETLVALLRRLS